MQHLSESRARRGAALIGALLVALAVAAMAVGAILMSSGAQLSTKFSAREIGLQGAANGGLEIVRDSINRGVFDSLLPTTGYTTLTSGASVRNASGTVINGYTRSLYVGRTGGRTGGAGTAGQYGSNFASALSVIRDTRGAVAARRLLLTQESWAKFAVAINNWSGSAAYGCGESVNGPFHSNTNLVLSSGCSSPRTAFKGAVTVVGSVTNQSSGDFQLGLKTGAPAIVWPTPARIALMRQYAIDGDASGGDYDITAPSGYTTGGYNPGVRLEFVTVDVNGNGVIDVDEGFVRVWRASSSSNDPSDYVTAQRWDNSSTTDPNSQSRNCGATVQLTTDLIGPKFHTARELYDNVLLTTTAAKTSAVQWLLTNGAQGARPSATVVNASSTPTGKACYLGGDPRLFGTTTGVTPDSTITNSLLLNGAMGWWVKRRTGPLASVASVRTDAAYLIPLGANANFKGVIYVNGDVAISGTLRGRVSVVATGNIVLADDLLYYNAPGTKCDATGDIFGAIATLNVAIADNNLQMPFRVNSRMYGGYDDTPADEQYNMFFLAAGSGTSGTGDFFATGLSGVPGNTPAYRMTGTFDASATAEACGGAPGGCIRITGGLAQGRVDYYTYSPTGSSTAYGFAEAHAYDACGAVNPPPYFPTTGRFVASRYYEVDPVWLNAKTIPAYFAALQSQ